MSFFDEGDEPRRRTRPRRPAARGGPAAADSQTMLIRRAVALGGAVLLLILLLVGIRGCLNSQRDRSLRDYNRDVTSVIRESDNQVGRPFFELLREGNSPDAVNLQTQVNQFRANQEDLVKRARNLDVPDQMAGAQDSLLLVLELRRDGLGKIAQKLPTALGERGAEDAVSEITGQMSAFYASDVVYSQRVVANIERGFADADVGGQRIATSRFFPGLVWLDESQVAERLGASVRPGGRGGKPAPGLHGHGLSAVSAGNVALTEGTANRIPAGADTAFTVKFQNQGENEEFDVPVILTIRGDSGKPIRVRKRVAQTRPGQEASVSIPLGQAPPIGRPVTLTVEVQGVPGEEKTDNNKQTFPLLFTP